MVRQRITKDRAFTYTICPCPLVFWFSGNTRKNSDTKKKDTVKKKILRGCVCVRSRMLGIQVMRPQAAYAPNPILLSWGSEMAEIRIRFFLCVSLVVLARDHLQREDNERERGEFIGQSGVQNVG